MKHFQNYTATGDIIAPVQMQQAGTSNVARTRMGFMEARKNKQTGQMEQHMVSQSVQAWGDAAAALAAIPQGNTVMISGKPENYKYKDQQGNEKWGNRITIFSVGNCGPSKYQQQTQQPAYNQAPQQGYQQQRAPQAGGSFPPNNSGGGYPPQQPGQQQQTVQPGGFDPNEQIPF